MKKFTITLLAVVFTTINAFSADYFWVAGSGNWSDFSNHWATTSGGATFHTQAPGQFDNVYFDAGSFSGAGEVVTIDAAAICADMDWTGATNTPALAGSSNISIYGSMTLIAGMNFNCTGYTYFEALSTGQTITLAGQHFNNRIYFQGIGGWILQDEFHVEGEYIYFYNGTLNTNDQPVFANRFYSNVTSVRNLSLGSSVFTLTYTSHSAFHVNGTNLTLDAGTSLFKLTANNGGINCFGAGNLALYNVICESTTGTSNVYNANGSFNTIVYNSHGSLQDGNTVDSVIFAGNGDIWDNNNNINYLKFNANGQIREMVFMVKCIWTVMVLF